jgi:hypothetical protein
MVESEFGVKAAQLQALAAELAAAVSADTSGVLAVEVLPEVFGARRQLDLLSCRLIERADRSGAFRVDGAASTAAFVRGLSGEHDAGCPNGSRSAEALADRMPVTAKAREAGDLGLDHATVIQRATGGLNDAALAAELEGFLGPGCDRPPSFTEAHHREHWLEHHGETKPDHLDLLCCHHHFKVHEDGWTITITIGTDPDRTPRFHPPANRPPSKGQRRHLFRPSGQTPRRT